jgi:hypothetical protein
VGARYRFQLEEGRRRNVTTLISAHSRADPRAVSGVGQSTAKPDDALVVMLIGHGTDDGVDYKFNIPGPDLTAAELAALLDRVPAARQCVVNMTSSAAARSRFCAGPTGS